MSKNDRIVGRRNVRPERSDTTAWDSDGRYLRQSAIFYADHRRTRFERVRKISKGNAESTFQELLSGYPPLRDDLAHDIKVYVARASATTLPDDVREALRHFEACPEDATAARLWRLTIDDHWRSADRYCELRLAERAAWYAAIFGDMSARVWLAGYDDQLKTLEGVWYRQALLSSGFAQLYEVIDWQPDWQTAILNLGRDLTQSLARRSDEEEFWSTSGDLFERVENELISNDELMEIRHPHIEVVNFTLPEKPVVQEDPDEIEVDEPSQKSEEWPRMLVIKSLPEGGSSDQKAFIKPFQPLCTQPTPLVVVAKPATVASDLIARWPHAADVIHRMLVDLQPGKPIRFKPTLLVGEPGSGKTRLLTTLAAALGLPSMVYPCASVSDSSFGGTPAQWSSRRTSAPMQAIRQYGIANPMIILDELEKTGQESHNGSLVHALLPMLETHSASAYWETALEVPVNLSAVNFLATANNLELLPDPLRDRFRVIRMPDATVEHLPVLSSGMLADMSADAGYELDPLEADEMEVIAAAWGGGSLRKLKSAIATTLEVRSRTRVLN